MEGQRRCFFATLELALNVVEYGFAMAGPPCSMFVFLSSGVHKRTAAQPNGDQSHKKVRLANLVASNALSIMKIMAARRVFVMIEQPLNSLMYHYEPFATWVAGNPSLFFVVTYMQAFGHDMVKPTKLLTNMKSARLLTRQRPARRLEASSSCESGDGQPGRKYLRMCPSGPSGDKDLQSSASYTQDFAQAVFSHGSTSLGGGTTWPPCTLWMLKSDLNMGHRSIAMPKRSAGNLTCLRW